MKKALATALALLPVSASAHVTAHEVGHLHPHGVTYALAGAVLLGVLWRLFRRG